MLSSEYRWIGVLFVVVGLVSLLTFARRKHNDLVAAEGRHTKELAAANEDRQSLRSQLEQSQTKLNTIGWDAISRIEKYVSTRLDSIGRSKENVSDVTISED